jgi:hypothetical protein
LLDGLTQLCDGWIQSIQQLQQIVPASAAPGRQPERFQLLASMFSPQPLLAKQALIRHRMVQARTRIMNQLQAVALLNRLTCSTANGNETRQSCPQAES